MVTRKKRLAILTKDENALVEGFKGDDSAAPAVQVFIEVYEGTLRVHTWDGTSQDPKTITIDPA